MSLTAVAVELFFHLEESALTPFIHDQTGIIEAQLHHKPLIQSTSTNCLLLRSLYSSTRSSERRTKKEKKNPIPTLSKQKDKQASTRSKSRPSPTPGEWSVVWDFFRAKVFLCSRGAGGGTMLDFPRRRIQLALFIVGIVALSMIGLSTPLHSGVSFSFLFVAIPLGLFCSAWSS